MTAWEENTKKSIDPNSVPLKNARLNVNACLYQPSTKYCKAILDEGSSYFLCQNTISFTVSPKSKVNVKLIESLGKVDTKDPIFKYMNLKKSNLLSTWSIYFLGQCKSWIY